MGEGAGTLQGPSTATVPPEPARSHPRHGRQGMKQHQSCRELAKGSLPPACRGRVPMEVLLPAPPAQPSPSSLSLPHPRRSTSPAASRLVLPLGQGDALVRRAAGVRKPPAPAAWPHCLPSRQYSPGGGYSHSPLQLLVLDGAIQRLQREERGCQQESGAGPGGCSGGWRGHTKPTQRH